MDLKISGATSELNAASDIYSEYPAFRYSLGLK